jgi:hypothetical protein
VHEFHARRWSVRYGSAAEPKVANGMRFDRLFRDRADMFEGEIDDKPHGRAGALRVLSFLNRSDAGTYDGHSAGGPERCHVGCDCDAPPGGAQVRLRHPSGAGTDDERRRVYAGGWNDGKTETRAFTAIDRLASGGVSVSGARWNRPFDTAVTGFTVGGISGVLAQYLARGGVDFIAGDGALRYAPEYVSESYYSVRVCRSLFATFDLQRVVNPANNHDRGQCGSRA